MPFALTAKQLEAQNVAASDATHILFEGGSRSGKTFLHVRNIVFRALKAPGSRHAILRFRLAHIRSAIMFDTLPRVMATAFEGVPWKLNKQDMFATIGGGKESSEVWMGGLDDKERTEKILGNEYSTILLNEASQISWHARNTVLTRLAQKCMTQIEGRAPMPLKTRMLYDCNPPNKNHWLYKVFHKHVDPDSGQPLPDPSNYAVIKLNPHDNADNLSSDYIALLDAMPARMRKRFRDGEYADANPNQLFSDEYIEKWRVLDGKLPDMVRIVVAVDPSGSGDTDNADNDAIGIVVAALGVDGNCYVIEDCTVKAGPATWGNVATTAYDRHSANAIVGEVNYGGAMVKHVIDTSRPRTPFQSVTASRGKHVRADPVAALYEQGKVRHVGYFHELEEELGGFTTSGYVGDGSPNRADALVWAITALFPGVIDNINKPPEVIAPPPVAAHWSNRRAA